MSVSIGNWELNRGPNSILVSTQNENGVAGKNVKLTKKDHLVTRLLLRFPGFFSPFLVTSTWRFELTLKKWYETKATYSAYERNKIVHDDLLKLSIGLFKIVS